MNTALQVSLYGLVMLASGMLAYGEGTGFPDAFTIPLAMLALFVTERWQLFWLRVRWANVLGLVAFGIAGWELSSGQIEARLLSLAHLLVYLTWIVLFLSKTSRMYWNLCLLSVLHVAVGAVLTSSAGFGLMCGVFLVLAVWTLTIFTFSRARQKYADESHILSATPKEREIPDVSATTENFVWNQRSRPASTVQIDPRLRWISGAFVSGVAVNVVLSAAVGVLFFVFTPRIWVGSFSPFGEAPDQPLRILQSGFAEEVQLGDIGQILEGTQTVMEVRFFDHATDQPIDIAEYAVRLGLDEPLFRGSVLGEYANGKWRATGRRDHPRIVASTPPVKEVIRQEFRVEPMDSGILFAMPPYVAGRLEHRLSFIAEGRLTSRLMRDDQVSGREPLKYVIFSYPPRLSSGSPFPRGTRSSQMSPDEWNYYLGLPERGLDRLQSFARQIAMPADMPNSTPTEMARKLVQQLRDSGEFGYTLDMSITDPYIDAVEDFLFNRKAGHCEYFASALALMLRAVGIPARLVSGFKGGDLNSSTGYFVVQGRHAHVWVEALIDGHWRILDATPASRSDSVKSLAAKANFFNKLTSFFTDTWSHHVVGLQFSEQNSSLYTPLKEWISTLGATLREDLNNLLDGQSLAADKQRHIRLVSLSLVLAISLGISLILVARSRAAGDSRRTPLAWLCMLLHWLLPNSESSRDAKHWRSRLARWWSALLRRLSGESAEHVRRVEFYERFLRLLRSADLEPLPAQTAREFVVATQAEWSKRLGDQELSEIPAGIVIQFYRVRFGDESLSSDEFRQLEGQLSQLEQHWHRRKDGTKE